MVASDPKMKKSYHSIIEPAQEAIRTVRIEREPVWGAVTRDVAKEVMPQVAVRGIDPQLSEDECCPRSLRVGWPDSRSQRRYGRGVRSLPPRRRSPAGRRHFGEYRMRIPRWRPGRHAPDCYAGCKTRRGGRRASGVPGSCWLRPARIGCEP